MWVQAVRKGLNVLNPNTDERSFHHDRSRANLSYLMMRVIFDNGLRAVFTVNHWSLLMPPTFFRSRPSNAAALLTTARVSFTRLNPRPSAVLYPGHWWRCEWDASSRWYHLLGRVSCFGRRTGCHGNRRRGHWWISSIPSLCKLKKIRGCAKATSYRFRKYRRPDRNENRLHNTRPRRFRSLPRSCQCLAILSFPMLREGIDTTG